MPPIPRFPPLPLAAAMLTLACGGGEARGGPGAAGSATLLPGSLQLAFATPAGQVPGIHTDLVLQPGRPLEVPFMAYLAVPPAGDAGPVALAVENRPPDLEVAVDGKTSDRFALALNEPHRLSLVDRGTPGPGTLAFRLRATIQGQDQLLPVSSSTSPAGWSRWWCGCPGETNAAGSRGDPAAAG